MRLKGLLLCAISLLTLGLWQAGAGQPPLAKQPRGSEAGLRERGAYLVNSVILCSDCHTPQDSHGNPDKAKWLRGTELPIKPKKETKNWADEAPDITASGLAGKWGEQGLVKFLTTGIDPTGNKARPPMPAFRLNSDDARAVAAYLHSLSGKEGSTPRQPKKSKP